MSKERRMNILDINKAYEAAKNEAYDIESKSIDEAESRFIKAHVKYIKAKEDMKKSIDIAKNVCLKSVAKVESDLRKR